MREWLRNWLMRSWRGPVDLEPQLFWLYLVCCWLFAGLGLWLYFRTSEALNVAMTVLGAALGIQALWALVRRRRSRQQE